jgi:alpha-tubulin suppressor-like RCC1 family protein
MMKPRSRSRSTPAHVLLALISMTSVACIDLDNALTACGRDPALCEDATTYDSSEAPVDARVDASADTKTESSVDSADADGDASPDGCKPIACPSTACGVIDNGCGGTLSCPGCVSPKTCDATTHTCTCSPLAACPPTAECGTVPDGCGGTVTCAACTGGKTCNTATNKCETVCTPIATCPVGKCGSIDNGCGTGTIDCGGCTGVQTCGGSGTPNVCGCTTAAAAAKCVDRCNSVSDECGTHDCGSVCASGTTCSATVCSCTSASCAVYCGTSTSCVTVDVLSSGPVQNATCAVMTDRSVRCWGHGGNGQMGDGTSANATQPIAVPGLGSNVQQIGFGGHGCAVMGDNTLKCWGINDYGQFCDGATATTAQTPKMIPAFGTTAKQVATMPGTTCVVTTAGAVQCCGRNGSGQLGNGDTTGASKSTPQLAIVANVQQLTAGGAHFCALMLDGSVQCWGSNSNGQIGAGTGNQFAPVLVLPSTPTKAFAVVGGGLFTCARMSDGTAKCWGADGRAQLGDGGSADVSSPKTITALGSGILQLTAGFQHACALGATGEVRCWGENSYGTVGNGSTSSSPVLAPYTVIAFGAKQVLAGLNHTCAVMSDGTARCWGSNSFGQVGNPAAGAVVSSPAVVKW